MTSFPYQGTTEELAEVEAEISHNQRLRLELDDEYQVLQEHRLAIIALLGG